MKAAGRRAPMVKALQEAEGGLIIVTSTTHGSFGRK